VIEALRWCISSKSQSLVIDLKKKDKSNRHIVDFIALMATDYCLDIPTVRKTGY
jgi:hypothetical protein